MTTLQRFKRQLLARTIGSGIGIALGLIYVHFSTGGVL